MICVSKPGGLFEPEGLALEQFLDHLESWNSELRERQPLLILVLPASVAVARLALFV